MISFQKIHYTFVGGKTAWVKENSGELEPALF